MLTVSMQLAYACRNTKLFLEERCSQEANVIYLSPVGILGCKQATYFIVLRGP